ncbi:hypothetical protein JHK87_024448 [Glycine soja]|nr:hypothetical protein JHK87_024448 [Glycine soja]
MINHFLLNGQTQLCNSIYSFVAFSKHMLKNHLHRKTIPFLYSSHYGITGIIRITAIQYQ